MLGSGLLKTTSSGRMNPVTYIVYLIIAFPCTCTSMEKCFRPKVKGKGNATSHICQITWLKCNRR